MKVRTFIFSIKDSKLIFVTLIRRSIIICACMFIFQTIYYNILHYYFKITIILEGINVAFTKYFFTKYFTFNTFCE